MPVSSTTDPFTIAAWMTSAAALFGISIGIVKARSANRDRIDDAKAEGTEAKTQCQKLEQKILESELGATEKFASIPHLGAVERRMKEEMVASEERSKESMQSMEGRLISAINERRKNHHAN